MVVPEALTTLVTMGWTLERALQDPAAAAPRNLDVVELWSGVGAVARAAARRAMHTKTFDRARVPGTTDGRGAASENILAPAGFYKALSYVLALAPGGLLIMAPECRSFHHVLNVRNTKRSLEDPAGDETYAPVATGNAQAAIAAFLYALAHLRGVRALVENPKGSYLFKLPVWCTVADYVKCHYVNVARCFFDTAPTGKRFLKIYTFAGGPWSAALATTCACGSGHRTMVSTTTKNGKRQVTGVHADLKESGAYPEALGEWIINCWTKSATEPRPAPARGGASWKRPLLDAPGQRPAQSWKRPRL